jgi:hypothetical protein
MNLVGNKNVCVHLPGVQIITRMAERVYLLGFKAL